MFLSRTLEIKMLHFLPESPFDDLWISVTKWGMDTTSTTCHHVFAISFQRSKVLQLNMYFSLIIFKPSFQTSGKGPDFTESDLFARNSSLSRLHDNIDNTEGRFSRHRRLCNMSRIKYMLKDPQEYNSIDELAKVVFLTIFIVFNGF